jgi:hypothetical protein
MTAFSHPLFLLPAGFLALLALGLGLGARLRPGFAVRVVGQQPLLQGLGLALLLGGAGLGLAEPRFGRPEVPRLTVHVVLDASRSMLVPDCAGASRWRAALASLDQLWAQPCPGVRFSLDLLTGDTIPLMPPGEDRRLLRDALRAVQPGDVGSPGTSMGRGLPQVAAQAEARAPAVILFLGDGEETWEAPAEALQRASSFLGRARLPLYALAFGQSQPQPVPGAADPATPRSEPLLSRAQPDFLAQLATASGGRLLKPGEDLRALFQDLALGRAPLPLSRSTLPAQPEWGAWLALVGLALWLAAAGRPMHAWRSFLGLIMVVALAAPARAELPLPPGIQAWLAQNALEAGDLAAARRWRPTGAKPGHRLLAAEISLRSADYPAVLATLAPLTGQGTPRPIPAWRAAALLLAARAWVQLERLPEARELLERLLLEEPGRPEAIHNLQTLLKDPSPPPPPPKRPPPPPPPKPSQGARQDELEGLRQRLPRGNPAPAGVKDL